MHMLCRSVAFGWDIHACPPSAPGVVSYLAVSPVHTGRCFPSAPARCSVRMPGVNKPTFVVGWTTQEGGQLTCHLPNLPWGPGGSIINSVTGLGGNFQAEVRARLRCVTQTRGLAVSQGLPTSSTRFQYVSAQSSSTLHCKAIPACPFCSCCVLDQGYPAPRQPPPLPLWGPPPRCTAAAPPSCLLVERLSSAAAWRSSHVRSWCWLALHWVAAFLMHAERAAQVAWCALLAASSAACWFGSSRNA